MQEMSINEVEDKNLKEKKRTQNSIDLAIYYML
jgi:hypothetical protein